MGALTLGSLAFSAYDAHADPGGAYFATTTRMWELGAGGLLALAPGSALARVRRLPWLGWLGLAMAAGSAMVLRGAAGFPASPPCSR